MGSYPPPIKNSMSDLIDAKRLMLNRHLRKRGIKDPLVLKAMSSIRREAFLPRRLKSAAYSDRPLSIGKGQTISQPYMVAYMIEALNLKGGENILEVGTGSGYAAAVLSTIALKVTSMERHESLAKAAQNVLKKLKFKNVEVICGDGSKGWINNAPYDAIVVAAVGPYPPETLKQQLKLGGRLVMPVGEIGLKQTLLRIKRISEVSFQEEDLGRVMFVPLIGEQGHQLLN